MTVLKPCPFCGGEVTVTVFDDNQSVRPIVCTSEPCKGSGLLVALGEREGSFDKAITAWNTRDNEQQGGE